MLSHTDLHLIISMHDTGVPPIEVKRQTASSLKSEVVKYSQPFPQFDRQDGFKFILMDDSKKKSSLVI